MKFWGVSLLVLLSLSTLAWQSKDLSTTKLVTPRYNKVTACEARPDFLTRLRPEYIGHWDQIDNHKLVARAVEFFAESEKREQIYAHHELDESKTSRVICSTGQLTDRLSLLAPVVISEKSSSLWQFQVMSEGDRHSFWNVKSPQHLKGFSDLKDFFKSQGVVTKIYKISTSQYEIFYMKKSKVGTQYVSIVYDVVEG